MARVVTKPDTLNELNEKFAQQVLTVPVFLNSVPKCGTHLIRNIFRMFVPVNQQYHDTFIQIPVLRQHVGAFHYLQPKLSWGHLLFSDDSAMALHKANHVVVVRDPYDWVLARARFFLSDNFQGNLEHLKGGQISLEEIMNMMIFGIHEKAPSLQEIYTHNAVAWLGTGVKMVRYEDLLKHVQALDTDAAEQYFRDLLSVLQLRQFPDDWRERVKVGSDREQSGTYRDNLSNTAFTIPATLPEQQRKLVEVAAPGLRALLGYSDAET
ncbi:hypothetical protein ACFOD1_03995 [Pseudidiomarina halophila]|uniref:Sulfotransferase domain-containing protein n=1 Tax=Pseudidiomarina halophila TaxID=1449799 RepID=A0A432XZM4_9GAMM|nr:hypothetical protein [Pseudidiomarina halophila]RUO54103.1 hypothetical protein CWI69_01345 [Pseudidiomarina halophila]